MTTQLGPICSMQMDRQTDRQRGRDRTKLIVTFCNFARVPKNKQKQEV